MEENQGTYELLDNVIRMDLEALQTMTYDDEKRAALVRETTDLISHYNESVRASAESYDKEARRELDEKKLKSEQELEMKKLDVPAKRLLLEIGKIVVPFVTAVGGWLLYDRAQKRAIRFEETGSFASAVGREASHLPKILK